MVYKVKLQYGTMVLIAHTRCSLFQFTTVSYQRQVESGRQATFEYAFNPSDTFSARPFGLTINLNYRDMVSNSTSAIEPWGLLSVCNETMV